MFKIGYVCLDLINMDEDNNILIYIEKLYNYIYLVFFISYIMFFGFFYRMVGYYYILLL